MPTPADNDPVSATPASTHSCPPEDDTRTLWTQLDMTDPNDVIAIALQRAFQQPTPPPQDSPSVGPTDLYISRRHKHKRVVTDDEKTVVDMLSPISIEGDKQDECELPAPNGTRLGSPSDNFGFSNVRVCNGTLVECTTIANDTSSFRRHLRLICDLAVGFRAHNHPNVKSIKYR